MERYSHQDESVLQPNKHCPAEKHINILLLGQTGVGKSTFINAFGNYIVNDTLQQAEKDKIQVVIPASFSFTNPNTFEEKTITLNEEDEYEKFATEGHSATQQCRSFIFPLGDRVLRFIDTPGVGDTRGLDQDATNFQEILNYIAQYEHLNAVCILLKPDEQRLHVLFRFCVNELLRHLHNEAKENLIFVFTNSRSTFFSPGSTKKLLDTLLNKHREDHNVVIPFSRINTFLFDNEPFRYLAIRKKGIHLDEEQTQSYIKSWEHSVKEYGRMMEYIVTRPLHAVCNTLSLNEAEQLVRKLPRPIAETAKLIEENIQLAKDHKKRVLQNPELASQGIPQQDVTVQRLRHPRTVCMGHKCCRVIGDGEDKKIEYISICHEDCYLKGVVQETLADPKLEDCTSMHYETGKCEKCGCRWKRHKHITYENRTKRTLSLGDIDKRISDLREEAAKIRDVYKKLAKFLHANAILPINDDIVEYLRYFIREEQMKQSAGARNADVIANLEKMMAEYTKEMELFKKTLEEHRNSADQTDVIKPEDIFTLVGSLYRLPITGQQIRQQVEGIRYSQEGNGTRRETYVNLPRKAESSKVMKQMIAVTSKNPLNQNKPAEDASSHKSTR